MTGLPTGRGPILASPWCGQVPGGRAEGLPSGGLKKTLEEGVDKGQFCTFHGFNSQQLPSGAPAPTQS